MDGLWLPNRTFRSPFLTRWCVSEAAMKCPLCYPATGIQTVIGLGDLQLYFTF